MPALDASNARQPARARPGRARRPGAPRVGVALHGFLVRSHATSKPDAAARDFAHRASRWPMSVSSTCMQRSARLLPFGAVLRESAVETFRSRIRADWDSTRRYRPARAAGPTRPANLRSLPDRRFGAASDDLSRFVGQVLAKFEPERTPILDARRKRSQRAVSPQPVPRP